MNVYRKTSPFILAVLLVSLGLAVFVSPLASSRPDGLERIAADKGFLEKSTGPALWRHSPAPEYAIPGVKNAKLATGLAGLAGTGLIFGVAYGMARMLATRREVRTDRDGGR